MAPPTVQIFVSEEQVAVTLAVYILHLSAQFIADKGSFSVVLSSGPLIDTVRKLTEPPYNSSIDWSKWSIFYMDERVVPLNNSYSNYKQTYDGFLSKEGSSPEETADEYEQRLKQLVANKTLKTSNTTGFAKFHLMLVGMGPEGHLNTSYGFNHTHYFSLINKTLTQCPTNVNLNKFKLYFRYSSMVTTTSLITSQFSSWIRYAITRNVQEVDLTIWDNRTGESFSYDDELFFNNSCFRSMRISFCEFNPPNGAIRWDKLKFLYIYWGKLVGDSIGKILSGSPCLETLELNSCYGVRRIDITSKRFKNLVLTNYGIRYPSEEVYIDSIEINAPYMLSLTIKGNLFLEKLLLLNVSSLVKADLNYLGGNHFAQQLGRNRDDIDNKLLRGLLLSLGHVNEITLGDDNCLEVPIPKADISPIKENLSPEKAAEEYEQRLKQLVANKKLKTSEITGMAKFDLMLVGMGPDGHVASLFCWYFQRFEKKKWVTFITDSPKPPSPRITFTFPLINSASEIAMVVTGEDAADAVKVTLGEHADYGYPLPVQKVKPEGGYTWFLDKEATSLLK